MIRMSTIRSEIDNSSLVPVPGIAKWPNLEPQGQTAVNEGRFCISLVASRVFKI